MSRFCIALMLAISAYGQAQSVKSFLDAAEEHNVDRRISVEQRNRAAAEFRQAWTSLLPSLSASGGWTNNQYAAETNFPNPATGSVTKLVILPKDQFDANFRFELPLIDTQRWFRTLAADSAAESASWREQVTRDAVRRQIVSAYYGYAAALAVHESAQKSASVAEAQLQLATIRLSAGSATELELTRAKAEQARIKQTVADAQSFVAISARTLETLSGQTAPASSPLPQGDMLPAPALAELEQGLGGLPAFRSAQQDSEAAGRVATAAKLAWLPSVSAQFTQRFTNATGFQGQSAVYNAGVNFAWRLDGPTLAGIGVQTANENAAALATERVRLQLRDQLHSDWQRLVAALSKIEAARAQVEAAQRATQVARDRYAVGAATQVDVIQAERDVFGAEVNQIQARAELATARAAVRLSAGQPLE